MFVKREEVKAEAVGTCVAAKMALSVSHGYEDHQGKEEEKDWEKR